MSQDQPQSPFQHEPSGTSVKGPDFPSNVNPRVWLLTDGLSPIAVALSRKLLEHGDCVVAGILKEEFDSERGDALKALIREGEEGEELGGSSSIAKMMEKRWRDRLRTVFLDGRQAGQMQAGIAVAVELFGHIDVLLICRSEALVGTIEELSQTGRTRSLITDQFETNFFGAVNIIKTVLPLMREKKNGHIIVLTGITAHLGTPGLGLYCASQWALEGYCDSLAYEIAPFNIKLTIVQPNVEIGVFTNKLTSVPSMPEYAPNRNVAPLARSIFQRLLDTINKELDPSHSTKDAVLHSPDINSSYATLPPDMQDRLVAETVHSLAAIGGHENPPVRLIVGFEGIASVKEKLKTISEELEDFIEVSEQVDLPKEHEDKDDENHNNTARRDTTTSANNDLVEADFMELDME